MTGIAPQLARVILASSANKVQLLFDRYSTGTEQKDQFFKKKKKTAPRWNTN
jgi:hypothetical protein